MVPESAQNARVIRFGVFEVDLQAGELRRSGLRIKLQEQPFKILVLLLEHPGELITRDEFHRRLWPADTFVEYDHSLNSSVKKLRQALGDDSDNPRFIETLPRRGYRFIVPIEGNAPAPGAVLEWITPPQVPRERKTAYFKLVIVAAIVVVSATLALWRTLLRTPRIPKVLRFTALTNDGRAKDGPMTTDGSRLYFTEILPGQHSMIFQVPIMGGEATPLPVPLKQPALLDLYSGTELLVSSSGAPSNSGKEPCSMWVQPVTGGSPQCVGTITPEDARFSADGKSIIYSIGNIVYSRIRDGSSTTKLLTAEGTPFGFSYSPDASTLRFTQYDHLVDSMDIVESKADGTGVHRMFPGSSGAWTPDGQFYVFQNRRNLRLDIWALPEQRQFRWRETDRPIQLTSGPLDFQDPLPSKDGARGPRAQVLGRLLS
jgi:DNA-binding winged helix-turn-helix (wHTH) protein